MFHPDAYLDPSAKLLMPDRILTPRDLLTRNYLDNYDLEVNMAMRPHAHIAKRLMEEEHLTRARFSSDNLRIRAPHTPTYM